MERLSPNGIMPVQQAENSKMVRASPQNPSTQANSENAASEAADAAMSSFLRSPRRSASMVNSGAKTVLPNKKSASRRAISSAANPLDCSQTGQNGA